MEARGVDAVITADPINILYATGVRNMSVFSMMGPSRFALVTAGTVVVWEFPGSEHLAAGTLADEVRPAPSITPVFDPGYRAGAERLVDEVIECAGSSDRRIAVERLELDVYDAFRRRGVEPTNATEVFAESRLIKTPGEIALMWASMTATIEAAESMRQFLRPGLTEIEIWAEFHRSLIASGGEYVSTRLAQSGPRTFPYFNEASTRVVETGDLFCLDTDAIGPMSYAADFSRTYLCGDGPPTATQTALHGAALDQLRHNAALLEPGRSFRSFAEDAWVGPGRYRAHGYSCLAHGLGLCGEYPYIPPVGTTPWTLTGVFQPGMVMCVESYVGSADDGQGVKVEDQFLITDDGAEQMSTASHRLEA